VDSSHLSIHLGHGKERDNKRQGGKTRQERSLSTMIFVTTSRHHNFFCSITICILVILDPKSNPKHDPIVVDRVRLTTGKSSCFRSILNLNLISTVSIGAPFSKELRWTEDRSLQLSAKAQYRKSQLEWVINSKNNQNRSYGHLVPKMSQDKATREIF
jgi:hypothetical protein